MMATNLAASFLEANVDGKVWKTSSKQGHDEVCVHRSPPGKKPNLLRKGGGGLWGAAQRLLRISGPLGVTHLASNIFNAMDDGAYCFALDAIQKRLGHK